MNPNQIPKPQESLAEIELDATTSVDDFIKELEAKEKDLQITADYEIEIEEPDFDPETVPQFVQEDLAEAAPDQATPAGTPVPAAIKRRVFELQNEVEELHGKITALRSERKEIQEKSDRRLKDFENYKYRMDRERRGAFIDQISNLASQMLPVLDNLDRALGSVDGTNGQKNAEFQQFYDGIALVNQQVNEVFSEMGVQPIATVGETFDPNFHEAVAIEERKDLDANTITEELLRGYRIGNRVIRHSMVKVTSAAAKPAREENAAESSEEGGPDTTAAKDSTSEE